MRCVIIGLALIGLGGDDTAKKDDAPRKSTVERIPDPDYTPKRGDHAMIFGYSEKSDRSYLVNGAKHRFVYKDYWKALQIKDYPGITELRTQGDLVLIPQKTGVLVLEIEKEDGDEPWPDAAVVRITDGPLKDQKFWVSEFNVCQLIENPNYEPPKPDKEAKPDPKAKEAAQQLATAERYRRAKNYPLARKWYMRVLVDFVDYPEAVTARDRLETLPK